MYLKNREGIQEYNIAEDWYKKRAPGISAMIRIYNEEQWIGPCLESILPFFDEIVITVYCTDRTKEIAKSFKSDKIKIYDYPFKLEEVNGYSYKDSVHDTAYYYNWSLSKTTKTTACKWDADMIMLSNFYKYYNPILKKNVVRTCGYNLASLEPVRLSKLDPYAKYDPRFFDVKKYTYWIQTPPDEVKGFKFDKYEPLAKHESFLYNEANLVQSIFPLIKKEYIPSRMLYLLRLYNFISNNDIYLGSKWWYFLKDDDLENKPKEITYLHTKYLKKNLSDPIYKLSENIKKITELGKAIDIKLPDCIFKKPEDYI